LISVLGLVRLAGVSVASSGSPSGSLASASGSRRRKSGWLPAANQRQQHREPALAAHRDDQRGGGSRQEPAVDRVEPLRMLERRRARACEQLGVFAREEIEQRLDRHIKHNSLHTGTLELYSSQRKIRAIADSYG